jgi:hypothetical protein
MYASAARVDNRHIEPALAASKVAIRYGIDPAYLRKGLLEFSHHKPQFEVLPPGPASQTPLRVLRISDPLSGIPTETLLGQ